MSLGKTIAGVNMEALGLETGYVTDLPTFMSATLMAVIAVKDQVKFAMVANLEAAFVMALIIVQVELEANYPMITCEN